MADGPETYDEEVTPSIDPPLIEPPSPATLLGRIFAHGRQERTVVRAPLVRLADLEPRPGSAAELASVRPVTEPPEPAPEGPKPPAERPDAGTADPEQAEEPSGPVAGRAADALEPDADERGAVPDAPEPEVHQRGVDRREEPEAGSEERGTDGGAATPAPTTAEEHAAAPDGATPRTVPPDAPRAEAPSTPPPVLPEPRPAVAVPFQTPETGGVATAPVTAPVAQDAPAVRGATRFCPVCDERGPVEADGLHCHRGHRLSPAHGGRRGGWLRRRSH